MVEIVFVMSNRRDLNRLKIFFFEGGIIAMLLLELGRNVEPTRRDLAMLIGAFTGD